MVVEINNRRLRRRYKLQGKIMKGEHIILNNFKPALADHRHQNAIPIINTYV